MQVRREWKQTISAKQGMLAVLVVILLLGGMGLVFMQYGHVSPFPPALYGVVLAIVWASALWDWRRFGRQALPIWRVVSMVGFSGFFGGNLMTAGTASREWVINIGVVLLIVVMGVSIFGPRPNKEMPHNITQ